MASTSKLSQALKCFNHERLNNSIIDNDKNIPDQIIISIAKDFKTRIEAYHLLYKTYLEKQFIKPHPSKLWYGPFDANIKTITLVGKQKGKVVAALTLVYDSPMGVPSEDIYLQEITTLRQKKRHIAEIISLSIDSSLKCSTKALVDLFTTAYLLSYKIKNATDFVVTVNPRHTFFYKRKLLFKEIGKLKNYNKVGGAPAVLLKLDLKHITQYIKNKNSQEIKRSLYPKFDFEEAEMALLKDKTFQHQKLTQKEFLYLFKNQRNIQSMATQQQLIQLAKIYPIEYFTKNSNKNHSMEPI